MSDKVLTCKDDCIHYELCKITCSEENWTEEALKELDYMFSPKGCSTFKNKAKFIELPYEPFPVVLSEDENNSDVFCPFCDTNLSGHYYGGDYEPSKIVPCFECGTWLDSTKAITKEEAKAMLKEGDTDGFK